MDNLLKQAHEQSKRTAQTLLDLAVDAGDMHNIDRYQVDLDKHSDPTYLSGTHKGHYEAAKKQGKKSLY